MSRNKKKKTYPQPPFKRFVKCQYGKILEPNYETAVIQPAVYSKRTNKPILEKGWTIEYSVPFNNDWGQLTICDLIIDTADNLEDLE